MTDEKEGKINLNSKFIVNPSIVFREESDNWALLFSPDTGKTFGLNPVSVLIWKNLDGKKTANEILSLVRKKCINVPDEVENHVEEFIQELLNEEFVHYNS